MLVEYLEAVEIVGDRKKLDEAIAQGQVKAVPLNDKPNAASMFRRSSIERLARGSREVLRTNDTTQATISYDGEATLYVEVDGKRTAKRRSGESWTALDPDYVVTGCEPGNYDKLVIEHYPSTGPH